MIEMKGVFLDGFYRIIWFIFRNFDIILDYKILCDFVVEIFHLIRERKVARSNIN
jgi:hypothetical protein